MTSGSPAKATHMVHWPGQSTSMCDAHLEKAQGIAAAMGFPLTATDSQDEWLCQNCVNEARKREHAQP
jgi:hypothetical protein